MTSSSSRTEAGGLIKGYLTDRSVTLSALAKDIGVSRVNLSVAANGRRHLSSSWADMIATGLGLNEEERADLHRAAARDNGFRIDLT